MVTSSSHAISFISVIVLFLLFGLFSGTCVQASAPGLGNGFEVDGNLLANNPGVLGLGDDWLDGPAGPGVGVFLPDSLGAPKNSLHTFHLRDLFKAADQNIFVPGNKVFDDPNTYNWDVGSSAQKYDIQHGMVHFSVDSSGNQWLCFAGDRCSSVGESYIDCEFLQNSLTKNVDGTFTSLGPDGGRTVGDFLLTIELTLGGSQASVFAHQWLPDGSGGFNYTEESITGSGGFVAANIDSAVSATFMVFGSNTYGVNQFGEAAVNLSQLLQGLDECFNIATLFIRTKSSASTTAELKDFIEPMQINRILDREPPEITCPADVMVPCDQWPIDTGTATAIDNCDEAVSISYSDQTSPGSCPDGFTIVRTWTATDDIGNSASCQQIIEVTASAAIPAASTWGMCILTLILLSLGSIALRFARR